MRWLSLVPIWFSLIAITSSANAGWWHHHCCCPSGSAPAYYAIPVATASQDSSQSALWEGIVSKLIDKIVGPITGGDTPNPTVNVDLSKIEAKLDTLAERVENINTTLRTHGETLVSIADRLDKLERKSGGGDANVSNK